MLDNYKKVVDYLDFLRAIRSLISEGKLINEEGVYRVEAQVFKELTKKWKKTPSPIMRKPNPLLSEKARTKSQSHPFANATPQVVSNTNNIRVNSVVNQSFKTARRGTNKKSSPDRRLEKENVHQQKLDKFIGRRESESMWTTKKADYTYHNYTNTDMVPSGEDEKRYIYGF